MSRKVTPAFETERKVFPQKLKRLFSEKFDENGNPISQKALADYLGVSRQSVSYYMQGQSEPSYEILVKIAQFFGVTIDYLLTETPLKSLNPTLSAAASYTGLSEEAITVLANMSKEVRGGISMLIEDEKYSDDPIKPHGILYSILGYISRPKSSQTVFVASDGALDIRNLQEKRTFIDRMGEPTDRKSMLEMSKRFNRRFPTNQTFMESMKKSGVARGYDANALLDRIMMEEITEKIDAKRAEKLKEVTDGEHQAD